MDSYGTVDVVLVWFKPVHFPCIRYGNATVLQATVFVYDLGSFELP